MVAEPDSGFSRGSIAFAKRPLFDEFAAGFSGRLLSTPKYDPALAAREKSKIHETRKIRFGINRKCCYQFCENGFSNGLAGPISELETLRQFPCRGHFGLIPGFISREPCSSLAEIGIMDKPDSRSRWTFRCFQDRNTESFLGSFVQRRWQTTIKPVRSQDETSVPSPDRVVNDPFCFRRLCLLIANQFRSRPAACSGGRRRRSVLANRQYASFHGVHLAPKLSGAENRVCRRRPSGSKGLEAHKIQCLDPGRNQCPGRPRVPEQATEEQAKQWKAISLAVYQSGKQLYQSAGDFEQAKQHYGSMVTQCNQCHQVFDNGKHQLEK